MNKEKKISKEIEKTLGQLKEVESLEPNPYLYTRIQQKLNEQKKSKFGFSEILKPALFTVLFTINVITVYWYSNSLDSSVQKNSAESLVEVFSSDFNIGSDDSKLLILE